MMYIHDLDGCAPAPLAHYLKALGVLRLVAEQADAQARGWWEGERFRLATVLSADELIAFLVEKSAPVAVFNPWGGRSGYFAGSSEKSARDALTLIEKSTSDRLAVFQSAIRTVRSIVTKSSDGVKPEGDGKDALIVELRNHVRGDGEEWLAVALAVLGTKDEQNEITYPPLFGTGGNEGSGSYTSAYMSAVVDCIVKRKHDHAVRSVLFGVPAPTVGTNQSMLQFLPEGCASPWEFLLAVAGAMTITVGVSSRNQRGMQRWAASPFFVAAFAAGYSSAARLDERMLKNGTESAGRGEQWFPLWSRPALAGEVRQIFVEGRASPGRQVPRDGWSMAKAVTNLGVRAGVDAFQRYGFLQRDNQSLHFAVSLGRIRAASAPSSKSACLDDIDAWVDSLHRHAYPSKQDKSKSESSALRVAYRRLSHSLFRTLEATDQPMLWQSLLHCIAEVEAVMKTGSGFKAQPAPPLRPEWVEAADDGSPEFRLALSLALQARGFRHGTLQPLDPIHRHWLPLDSQQARPRFATTGDAMHPRLDKRPEVVMRGRHGIDDAVALVERRIIEGTREGRAGFGLLHAPRASADPADLSAWLQGRVDPDRTLALARALMALDRRRWAEQIVRRSRPAAGEELPEDAWLCIRLVHLPWPLPDGRRVPCDPAIVRRLASGDAAAALQLALRRLQAVGIRPGVRAGTVPAATARLWAAALAFPISQKTASRLVARLDTHFAQENFA